MICNVFFLRMQMINNNSLRRTVWNRHASDVLRGVVRRLESARATGGTAPAPSTHLTRLHVSHSVSYSSYLGEVFRTFCGISDQRHFYILIYNCSFHGDVLG